MFRFILKKNSNDFAFYLPKRLCIKLALLLYCWSVHNWVTGRQIYKCILVTTPLYSHVEWHNAAGLGKCLDRHRGELSYTVYVYACACYITHNILQFYCMRLSSESILDGFWPAYSLLGNNLSLIYNHLCAEIWVVFIKWLAALQ